MRGLKFDLTVENMIWSNVAPYTGAWIEIRKSIYRKRERIVAPYTGAGIEINRATYCSDECRVAPYTGAWIEISN